jgi:hypothetical protein
MPEDDVGKPKGFRVGGRPHVIHNHEPESRIIAALERLHADDYPVPEGTIPYRHSILMIARQLMIMRRVDTDTRPKRAAYEDLSKIARDARSLSETLEKLCDWQNGLAIPACAHWSRDTAAAVFGLSGALSAFAEVAAKEPATPAHKNTRLPKAAPVNIVKYLSAQYEILTGRKPTLVVKPIRIWDTAYSPVNHKSSGKFFDCVKEVFAALGMKDSPEAAIKSAFKEDKERPKRKSSLS